MTTDLDDFETSLLRRLRDEVEAPDRRPQRRWGLIGSGAGVAALAGGLVLPGLVTSPAYSVTEGNAGEVTVGVERLEDAEGLEQALAEKGIQTDITYLPHGQQCEPGRYRRSPGQPRGLSLSVGARTFEVTLAPGVVGEGETLVVAASMRPIPPSPDTDGDGVRDAGGAEIWVDAEVAAGPVGPCVPTDG